MAKSKLKAVAPKAAEPSKPKVLIYGKPGVGKTWASLDFPNVYYIDTEGGANLSHYTDKLEKSGGAYLGIEQGSLDFEEVIEQIQALATEKHQFKTLVIDSFSKLYLTFAANAAEKVGDNFGRDRKEANKPTKRLINWLNKLDMNVILIAHEKPLWGLDDKGNRSEIGVTFDAYDKIEYELHLCMNIIKVGADRRARVTKSRLMQFPDATVFPWSYEDFAERYGREVLEKQGNQIILASESEISEIKYLLSKVKLPEGQQEKWFTHFNITGFEELESSSIQKIITGIKEKYIPKIA